MFFFIHHSFLSSFLFKPLSFLSLKICITHSNMRIFQCRCQPLFPEPQRLWYQLLCNPAIKFFGFILLLLWFFYFYLVLLFLLSIACLSQSPLLPQPSSPRANRGLTFLYLFYLCVDSRIFSEIPAEWWYCELFWWILSFFYSGFLFLNK